MARLLCDSNINFTGSWKVIDSTSFTSGEASWSFLSNIYQSSTNFTPGAITVEGLLVKLGCFFTYTGTLSVELYNATAAASVAGTEVTTNVSSIPQQLIQNYNSGGWLYFKFSSPVTLLAATNYNLRIKASTAYSILMFRSGTANDWTRGLVTSTTASPAASDTLILAAPYTGSSAPSYITCTMNNTSSDVYASVELGAYSKMILENSASTNYLLNIATGGNFITGLNSVAEFGTLVSPVQQSSSFTLGLQSSSAAANQLIIRNLSSFTACGYPKTRKAKLAANSSVGATSLTTNVSTGWKNGDNIVFGSTVRGGGAASTEKKALTADASGTTLTITAMTLAKLGTAPIQCDIGNVTSNCKIIGTSTTSTFIVQSVGIDNSTTVAVVTAFFDNVEFRYIGGPITTFKSGIELRGSIGSTLSVTNCGFHDVHTSSRLFITNSTGNNQSYGLNIDGNVINGGNFGITPYNSQSLTVTGDIQKINNNLLIGQSDTGIYLGGNGFLTGYYDINNNIVSGCFYGIRCTLVDNNTNVGNIMSGNTCYGMTFYGFDTPGIMLRSTVKNQTCYLCNNQGIFIQNAYDCVFDGGTVFANGPTTNVVVGAGDNIIIRNYTINSYAANTSNYNIFLQTNGRAIFFDNCNIGTTVAANISSVYTEGATSNAVFRNSTLGNSTFVTFQANSVLSDSRIAIQRNGGVAGVHRVYKSTGTIFNDAVIYDSSPSSSRLTPSSASVKLKSTSFQIPVANGGIATISIKVRKSVVGDGTVYNGNQPRLILKTNPSAGSAYNEDIICATATNAANGAWETLTYTLPSSVTDNVGMEFYVDCDGTTGWINVDSLTSNTNNSIKYYINGYPISDLIGSSERSFTFIG